MCLSNEAAAIKLAERDNLVGELVEALEGTIDAIWVIDSHEVNFDPSVVFSQYYDFSGLDGCRREEFLAEHCCIVWPRDGKWSAYCTHEGSLWFEKFDSAAEAKEQCMKLLDVVMPNHPAMLARAVLAKAREGDQS